MNLDFLAHYINFIPNFMSILSIDDAMINHHQLTSSSFSLLFSSSYHYDNMFIHLLSHIQI
jgi:hypothetical protein